MTTSSIYSGLSNHEAFALMNAQIMVNEEYPSLSRWNERRYWRIAALVGTVFAAIAAAVAASFGASPAIVATVAASAGLLVAAMAFLEARSTRKRLAYLSTLKVGLEQFELAGQQSPGASAADLLGRVSDMPLGDQR